MSNNRTIISKLKLKNNNFEYFNHDRSANCTKNVLLNDKNSRFVFKKDGKLIRKVSIIGVFIVLPPTNRLVYRYIYVRNRNIFSYVRSQNYCSKLRTGIRQYIL